MNEQLAKRQSNYSSLQRKCYSIHLLKRRKLSRPETPSNGTIIPECGRY